MASFSLPKTRVFPATKAGMPNAFNSGNSKEGEEQKSSLNNPLAQLELTDFAFLIDNIIFGAHVQEIGIAEKDSPEKPDKLPMTATYEMPATGCRKTNTSDDLILAIPYTSHINRQEPWLCPHAGDGRPRRCYIEVSEVLLQYLSRRGGGRRSSAEPGLAMEAGS